MKQAIPLIILVIVFATISCEKSNPEPDDTKPGNPDTEIIDEENDPLALYDSIPLNEFQIIWGGNDWHVNDFEVVYKNSKLYFNLHTIKNFDATVYFVLVNFGVDSFAFGIESSNIANYRYPTFNEYGALEDMYASSYNGDFPGGYFKIEHIDTIQQIIKGYFEFMNPSAPNYPSYKKIQKSFFKVEYELGPSTLQTSSAQIYVNSKRYDAIDMPALGYFPYVHSWIVFRDNSALAMSFFFEEIELGINHVKQGGFNAAWLENYDFPLSYYNFPDYAFAQADSGYVDVKVFDNTTRKIEGVLNLYIDEDYVTGEFIVGY